jgi:2-phosphoglycerate kinase
MKKYKNKIILIGGASSVSKSSYSLALMKKYNIVHKMGLGWIREMAKVYISKKKLPELYNHSFETNINNPIKNLYLQSIPQKKMVQFVIDRANREGQSIIIEGVGLVPGLMEFKNIDKKILLIVEDEKKHWNMVNKNTTHRLRKVPYKYFKNIRSIQKELLKRAKKNNWKIIKIS